MSICSRKVRRSIASQVMKDGTPLRPTKLQLFSACRDPLENMGQPAQLMEWVFAGGVEFLGLVTRWGSRKGAPL
jgi:hypothetical protein